MRKSFNTTFGNFCIWTCWHSYLGFVVVPTVRITIDTTCYNLMLEWGFGNIQFEYVHTPHNKI